MVSLLSGFPHIALARGTTASRAGLIDQGVGESITECLGAPADDRHEQVPVGQVGEHGASSAPPIDPVTVVPSVVDVDPEHALTHRRGIHVQDIVAVAVPVHLDGADLDERLVPASVHPDPVCPSVLARLQDGGPIAAARGLQPVQAWVGRAPEAQVHPLASVVPVHQVELVIEGVGLLDGRADGHNVEIVDPTGEHDVPFVGDPKQYVRRRHRSHRKDHVCGDGIQILNIGAASRKT